MAWYFTTHGFFSVVCGRHQRGAKRGQLDPDTIMVRARSKQHLVTLMTAFPDFLSKAAIKSTRGTDYPHRIVVSQAVWVELATRLASEVCYGNFKSAVGNAAEKDDPEYVHLLHRVWQAGVDFQDWKD